MHYYDRLIKKKFRIRDYGRDTAKHPPETKPLLLTSLFKFAYKLKSDQLDQKADSNAKELINFVKS